MNRSIKDPHGSSGPGDQVLGEVYDFYHVERVAGRPGQAPLSLRQVFASTR
jgi:hypothetical protein